MTFTYSPPPVIIDASVAIELVSGSAEWSEAFHEWAVDGRMRLVPLVFFTETANGLMLGGSRLAATKASYAIGRLVDYGIEAVDRGLAGLADSMAIAERHGLTVYDALYLQLALDVDGELATLDGRLRAVAQLEEVALIPGA